MLERLCLLPAQANGYPDNQSLPWSFTAGLDAPRFTMPVGAVLMFAAH
ncbi:hypothetical protein NJC38_08285 [Pseudomonas sp. 21LCFQ010]|nr:hypothetical protein [Pseudomonas sp. 21LCFQ010]MCO8162156.1 hypothetical protein [Pseudomonas sp. 21LCFQ010]